MSNKNIENNWFYIFDKIDFDKIVIKPWVYAIILAYNLDTKLEITLSENSSLDFYWAFFSKNSQKLVFTQNEDNSKLNIKNLYLNNKIDISQVIESNIKSSNSKSYLNMISIIKSWVLNLDAKLHIKKWSSQIDSYLKQENIFIWDAWCVKWVPKLFVEADDIKASHSCSIEKIKESEVFYLESRWLDRQMSLNLILESKFVNTFNCLKMIDKDVFDRLYKDFEEWIRE